MAGESSIFGSGLDSNQADYSPSDAIGGAGPGAASSNGADVPPDAALPPNAAPTEGQGLFGSAAGASTFGMPKYTSDPQAAPLDAAASLLQQRIQRANAVSSNPIAQLLDPEGVQAARTFVPQAAEALQKIQQQKAQMAGNRQQAENLGLAPGAVPDEADAATRMEFAKSKALTGDLKVFKGIQAVDPKAAEAIAPQVLEAASGHLNNAQFAFDKLANMTTQGEYVAAVNELRRNGTLTGLEQLGLKVPPTLAAFNAAKAGEGQALREARIGMNDVRTKLEERNTYQPMEKKVAETYAGRITTPYGDTFGGNGTWSTNAASGVRGLVTSGADDPRKLGDKFSGATPDQRKDLREAIGATVPKEEMEKYRNFNRTYKLATTGPDGKQIPPEGIVDAKGKRSFINTNPNVQQGIAEGLASMLRGGSGGATAGLLNIETGKRGYVQAVIDKIITNAAGGINSLKGEQVLPYLSELTQDQMRAVLDGLKKHEGESIESRVAQPGGLAERAGALGLKPADLGLSPDEVGGIGDAMERGRQAMIEKLTPMHQAIGGGDGVFQLNAQRPGAGAAPLPPGTQPSTQQPGAKPVATPVQQAASPPPQQPAPAATQPTGPQGGGGGPQPMTIAGQSVNVPPIPGASPEYLRRMQSIESRDEKDPWRAGAKGSSASGAFQAINGTWKQFKPPGAPDRAADATPQQQTEFAANFTAYNANSLHKAGLPVNDVNLYIAHNLGDGGAKSLLNADPGADARSIVGEKAAANNPLFYKGRPTVATVLARYKAEMDGSLDDTGPKPKPGSGGATAETVAPDSMWSRVGALFSTQGTNPETGLTPEGEASLKTHAVENAPAIGSTLGAIGGSAAGPAGTVGGGAAGGAAGQVIKDYVQGRDQSATRIAKQAALGGVLGIAPEGRPLLGAVTRAVGASGVEAGATAAEGGDAGDVAGAAATGGAYALGGEVLGKFISALGPASHKVLSNYLPNAQKAISAEAGKLAEARATLATEQPKLPGEGSGPNPKYEAAKRQEESSTQYIKDHGQSPDDMVYAYEQAKAGTSKGEAAVMKGANSEKTAVSQGYDDLRTQARETGVGAVKGNQPVPDGPLSMLRTSDNPTGKVPEAFRADAEHAEMLIKAPAKDWGAKWQQLQTAGSELIKKRVSFLANNDKPSAEAMDELFKGVRNQQKAAAEYVFGEAKGKQVIGQLEQLDQRYAKVMNATAGMKYEKMKGILASGNTPERRELEQNFREFAKNDPSAIRAFNAMKAGARGDWKSEASLMGPVIAGEVAANMHGVPTVGAITALVGAHRLYKLMQGYMNARMLNQAVTFKDFLAKEVREGVAKVAGGAAQRGVVQEQPGM